MDPSDKIEHHPDPTSDEEQLAMGLNVELALVGAGDVGGDTTTYSMATEGELRQRKGPDDVPIGGSSREDEIEAMLPALDEADIKRLRIRSLLGDGEHQEGASLLSMGDRFYIVLWFLFWTITIFGGFWLNRGLFGVKDPDRKNINRVVAYWSSIGCAAVVCALVFLFPHQIRSKIMKFLFGRDWQHTDDGVTEYYEGVKLWLLFPISVLGLWAPKTVPVWCRVLHLFVGFAGISTLVGLELRNIFWINRGTSAAENVTYLLFEVSEVILFVVGVVVYRNEKFVMKLFLFDNTKVRTSEAAAASVHRVSKKKLQKKLEHELNRDMDSPTDEPDGDEYFSMSSMSSQVTTRTKVIMEQETREGQISLEIIQSAWRWVVRVTSPIVSFAVVAWIASISIDTIPWQSYGKANGVWMATIYAVSPISGTNYFVPNLFLSGSGYIVSTHVWFTCYSVSMELNRIVIQLSEGYLSVSDLLDSLRKVRERMEYLFEKAQYIVVYQVWFAMVLLAFVGIEFFKLLGANQPEVIKLDLWTMVGTFSFILQALLSVMYASQIFFQHRLLVSVVRVQQEIQMKTPGKRDLTGLVLNLQASPIGLRVCGVYLNRKFLQRLVALAGGQAFAVLYRQFSNFLK